jgi:transposase
MSLKAIGIPSARVFVLELFGGRQIQKAKELGSLAGLVPVPYTSGQSAREQGISQAGNRPGGGGGRNPGVS